MINSRLLEMVFLKCPKVHLKLDLAEKTVVAHFSTILKFSGKKGVAWQKLRETLDITTSLF